MIISPDGKCFTNVIEDDGNIIIHHAEDTTLIAEQAKFLRENTDRGFTADRQMQLVGYIPLTDWYANCLHKRPMEDTVKFIESDERMRPYRVSERNTGHSGKIIIK